MIIITSDTATMTTDVPNSLVRTLKLTPGLLTMLNVAFYRVNMGKITKGRAAKPAQTLFKTTQEHKIQQQVSLF